MIAIQSNKKLQATVPCFVKMEIPFIHNNTLNEVYELNIVDTCFDTIIEEVEELGINGEIQKKQVEKIKVFETKIRPKTYSYAQIIEFEKQLNLSSAKKSFVEKENELFSKALLAITQLECQQGISGEGRGMYFSEAQDWEIINN